MLQLGKKYSGERNLSQTVNNIIYLALPTCLKTMKIMFLNQTAKNPFAFAWTDL